jgi:hypothetical protein
MPNPRPPADGADTGVDLPDWDDVPQHRRLILPAHRPILKLFAAAAGRFLRSSPCTLRGRQCEKPSCRDLVDERQVQL